MIAKEIELKKSLRIELQVRYKNNTDQPINVSTSHTLVLVFFTELQTFQQLVVSLW